MLAAAGGSFADVVKVTVFLVDVDDRPAVNVGAAGGLRRVAAASTLVEVSRLAIPGARVEVEAVALIP